MNDKYEKPLEANCETKDSVFSDDEENDLLDSASMNKRPKKKDQPLEVLHTVEVPPSVTLSI